MYQSIQKPPIPPPPHPHPLTRACPGHLTGVLLRTVGNSTENEARPVGHLILLSKRWSASQAKGFRNSFKKPVKVARCSFSRSIPPKFERKLRRHKQGFGKIDTSVILDKEENWL